MMIDAPALQRWDLWNSPSGGRPKDFYRNSVQVSSGTQANLSRSVLESVTYTSDRLAQDVTRETASSSVKLAESVAIAKQLDEAGRTSTALNRLYKAFETELWDSNFAAIEHTLRSLNPDELSSDILLGILTVTLPAKYRFPSRDRLLKETERLLKRRKQWERGILSGL